MPPKSRSENAATGVSRCRCPVTYTSLLQVLLGVVFLEKHASRVGILALTMCILASTQYSQAPLRKDTGLMAGAAKARDTEEAKYDKADTKA